MDLFHDKLPQMVEDVFQIVSLCALPGRHVLQDRLFAEVEADHLRHEGIDRLVIGHPRAGGRGDGNAAGTVDIHQAGNAQHGIGPEAERVQIGVVDPAIDHIDLLRPFRRPHPDETALDEQIGRFDQFHAHQVGKEGVFVIGRVVMPRRQDHHRRFAVAFRGRDRGQRAAQDRGIGIDRLDPVLAEERGEHPHHDLAVFQHVADAGGGAAVVFQHEEIVRPGADKVDPDDMAVDALGRDKAGDGLFIRLIAIDQPGGNAARANDLPPAVDIDEKGVQRLGPLLDPAFETPPFGLREDTREHVEGDQPVGIATLAIDREGDADAAEQRLRLGLLHLPEFGRHVLRPVAEFRVMRPDAVIVEHLVEERWRHTHPPCPALMKD